MKCYGEKRGVPGAGAGLLFYVGDQGRSSDDHLGTELNEGERHTAVRRESLPGKGAGGVWGKGRNSGPQGKV